MKSKITLSNIQSFFSAYKNLFLTQLGNKPEWFKEQVAYRMELCKNDCMIKRECLYCGCKVPEKLFSNKSCNNGKRFPDIMNENEWLKFKEKHEIK